jgi:hypothetical protein
MTKNKRIKSTKRWRENHPGRATYYMRKKNYLKNHGVTPEEAEQILINQGGKCAICNELTILSGKTGGHLDHNHINNEIRGVLCYSCNVGLGHFKDNINNLLNAISYLKKKKFILVVNVYGKENVA